MTLVQEKGPPPATSDVERARPASLAALAAFLPAALVVGLWVLWVPLDGGYFPNQWYPSAIGLLALLVSSVVARREWLPGGSAARLALLLLGAFAAWSLLSMLWAGSPGGAWEAGNLLGLYVIACWIVVLAPWRAPSASVLLGSWSLAVALVCAIALVDSLGDADLAGLLTFGRFSAPIGYANASAAVAGMAFLGALLMAYRREHGPVIQALFLATAVLTLEFGLLAQSRAMVFGLVAGVLVMVALASDRVGLLARLAVVAGALALTLDPVLSVHEARVTEGAVEDALREAIRAIALGTAIAAIGAVALAAAERFIEAREERRRRARRVLPVAGAVVAVAVLVAGVANAGRLAGTLESGVDSLTNDALEDHEGPRFATLDPEQRFDYWRVSLELFGEAPLVGVGAGNFERNYTERRDEDRHSRFAHNVWLQSMSETGLVGTLLFAGFLGVAAGGVLRRFRRLPARERAVCATCLAVAAYFLVHASLDWIDHVPAVAAPALGLLFVALRLAEPKPRQAAPSTPPAPRARRRRALAVAAGAVLAGLMLVSLALPYLADRYVANAFDVARSDPAAAYRQLERAASMDKLSIDPPMSEGTIAVSLGHLGHARRAFRSALEREEHYYPYLELGLIEARRGRFDAAQRLLERARRLSGRDFAVAEARRRVARRRRIDPSAFNRMILRETRSRFTRTATGTTVEP